MIEYAPIIQAARKCDWQEVSTLLDAGTPFLGLTDGLGRTLLQIAAEWGQAALCRRLIEAGADMHWRDQLGDCVLHAAAASGDMETLNLFIEKGLDPEEEPGEYCESLLHSVALQADVAFMRRLLELSPDLEAGDEVGRRPLHYAARENNTMALRFLLEAGADINAPSDNGSTALMYATYEEAEDALRFLLDAGADVQRVDHWGGTALHSAMQWGNTEIIRMLLQAGIEVNTANRKGVTALIAHCKQQSNSWEDVVTLLLEAGADATLADAAGQTALHHAVKARKSHLVPLLRAAGASPTARDKEGTTPLDLAESATMRRLLGSA